MSDLTAFGTLTLEQETACNDIYNQGAAEEFSRIREFWQTHDLREFSNFMIEEGHKFQREV